MVLKSVTFISDNIDNINVNEEPSRFDLQAVRNDLNNVIVNINIIEGKLIINFITQQSYR